MGGVKLHYVDNPISYKGARRATVAASGTVADCVRLAFPDLQIDRLVFVRGFKRVDADALVTDGDHIVIAHRVQAPVAAFAATEIGGWIVQALVFAAVSYLVGYLLRPKEKKNKQASPAYNVNLDQNAARLGQTMPVIYGRVLAVPDIASQPYAEFLNHNERVSMILSLGLGEYQINDIFVGESRIADFPSGTVRAWIYPPSAHRKTLGIIESETGIVEDMMTIPEAGGVDIAAPNDPSELIVTGTASGGTLSPDGSVSGNIWNGLVPGKRYVVTAGGPTGQSAVLTYVGVGANNSAVFDGPLPAGGAQQIVPNVGTLVDMIDAQEGAVKRLQTQTALAVAGNDIVYIEQGTNRFGPYQVYRFGGQGQRDIYMRKQGPGFAVTNDGNIPTPTALNVLRNYYITYSITEWTTDTPTAADPYRWRGWYALPRADSAVDRIFVDLVLPNGLAWVTDGGDYNNEEVLITVQIQQIDANNAPIGGVRSESIRITGATSSPRRLSFSYNVGAARYRIRLARTNTRDQRASKEISATTLSAIRGRIYHPPGTAAYEDCTLVVMQFTASAGLTAAGSRRVKVDATRRLPDLNGNGLTATTNPANAVRDMYCNAAYGAGRPASEFDAATFARLATQWGTTAGFSAVFDQPATVIEAMQSALAPVRAMPLPIGTLLSVAQDAPRARAFVFGPDTIVGTSLNMGYNFDGLDEPDSLEILYNDPTTFAEARVFYPTQGAKPESIELFGCTNRQQALDWGRLAWQERLANRKTCQFELEGEGYLLQPLTRFAVAVDAIDHGVAGIVLAVDGSQVQVDTPIPSNLSAIKFKQWDGTTGALHTITARDASGRWLTLSPSPGADVHPSDQYGDPTRWVAGDAAGLLFEFSVTNLESAGAMRVKVTGTQYTAAKFSGTFVENWTT